MGIRRTSIAFLLAGAAIALTSRQASADTATATSEGGAQASATKDVRDADRALKRRDFRQAGELYERAHQRAGTPGLLVKAAQGWAHAGELARAANRYADYLASAPANAPQRRKADKALKTLAAKLGRIEVRAVDVDHLTLDGAPLDQNSSYVTTGAHTVAGQTIDHRAVVASTSVAVGETATVSLSPPAPEPAPAPVLARPTLPILANTPAPRGGWSPAVVVAGGGVTAALLGLTIWSGLDTVSYKNKFDQDQSRENLDTGHSKQTRTNILIGATAGAAALTTLAAIVLVDWKGKEKEAPGTVQLGFGVGSAVVTGSF